MIIINKSWHQGNQGFLYHHFLHCIDYKQKEEGAEGNLGSLPSIKYQA
jgi:hypothetical protein